MRHYFCLSRVSFTDFNSFESNLTSSLFFYDEIINHILLHTCRTLGQRHHEAFSAGWSQSSEGEGHRTRVTSGMYLVRSGLRAQALSKMAAPHKVHHAAINNSNISHYVQQVTQHGL